MDKNQIIRTRDLLYENSVSLATAAVFKLEEDILSKKKILLKSLVTWTSFGDVRDVELTDGREKKQEPRSFYTFGGSAPGAPIFDLSEICGGIFCGFLRGHCTRGVYLGRGNCQDWWHLQI